MRCSEGCFVCVRLKLGNQWATLERGIRCRLGSQWATKKKMEKDNELGNDWAVAK